VRLIVRASHLPPEIASCEGTTTLDYGRVRLNGSEFLLPSESRLRILNLDGTTMENRTTYTACHEFHADSTLSFGAPLDDSAHPALTPNTSPPPLEVPAGLAFKTAFKRDLDTATAAAGDLIELSLKSAVRDSSKKVWLPEGMAAAGRIVRIQHDYGRLTAVTLVMKLETLYAMQDRKVTPFLKGHGMVSSVNLGTLANMEARNAAILYFQTSNPIYVVPRGTEIKWLTSTKGPLP
jgi:hypothetical protein